MRVLAGHPLYRLIAVAGVSASLALTGCGDEQEASSPQPTPAPAAGEFPAPPGSLEELIAETGEGELVASPSSPTYAVGRNRIGFGLFTVEREQIADAEMAIYAAAGPTGRVLGPFPARAETLATEAAFVAENTAADSEAAQTVFVTEIPFDRPGEWRLVALVRQGEEEVATRVPSVLVTRADPVPAPGEMAPRVHTPTSEDVTDLTEIDTRVPPSTQHEDDLAEVLGVKPVVLLFATPAHCVSRVCGPVVDIAEQVKRDRGEEASFIHMEIYEKNDPNLGARPQVAAYNLETEPWLFVIDEQGRIDTRIAGAFSAAELEAALDRVRS